MLSVNEMKMKVVMDEKVAISLTKTKKKF